MSGLSSTLSIAKTGIAAQQYGLNVTGHNIANVNNPDYSVQSADQKSMKPSLYGGFLFGTGVDTFQIRQSVDQLLEQRLTTEVSSQASFGELESYMRVLEGFFNESSKNSISNVLKEFWGSWEDLANNPEGSSERVVVFENGEKLAGSFRTAVLSMDDLTRDINADIQSATNQINEITKKIAVMNQEVLSSELNRTANDQRDERNRLVKELGNLIGIDTFEQADGALIVNIANSFTIVSGVDTYGLSIEDGNVVIENSSGSGRDISEKITSGKIGGLLEMRDVIVPKYRAEVNELSKEMIWAMNYQHSQGAGLAYFSEPVTGDYETDDSRWLTSYSFGDKIDNSKDFTLWVEDKTDAETAYTKISMDMGLSKATLSDWQGTSPLSAQSIYKLSVVDGATIGDKEVTETDGDGLAQVFGYVLTSGAATTVSMALDRAIAEQTLTIYNGPDGTSVINVKDIGGTAKRSAASIAAALNKVDGVTAYASQTSVTFTTGGIGNAQDGDEIQYSFYVEGLIHNASFIRDASAGTLQEQFEDSLFSVAESINNFYGNKDLSASGLSITSSSGKTLGIQDFEVLDNAGVKLNVFSGFNAGDTITFTIDSMVASNAASTTDVSIDLTGVDTSDQAEMALAFSTAIASALSGKSFTVKNDLPTNSVILRTTDGSDIRIKNAGNDTDNDATVQLSALSGTTADAGNIDSVLDFTAAATDTARYNSTTTSADSITFASQGTQVTVNESTAGAVNKTAVVAGTLTITMDPGMTIRSNVSGAGSGGLFSTDYATMGSSIITLGGRGGFSGFTYSTAAGETISFDLDGNTISFSTTAGAGTSDIQLATLLAAQIVADLTTAGVDDDYEVIRIASSVSVIKNKSLDDPITIENFTDSYGTGGYASIRVRTGTGEGIHQPENSLLESDPAKTYRNFATSSLYDDTGIIKWERLDKDGLGTGSSGFVTVEDQGRVSITEGGTETMSFEISKGSLVAGNVLTINTDTAGHPDPLNFRVVGRANSINDIYRFRVVSGGKVGHEPATGEDPLVIEWENSVTTGTFTIEGSNPPYTPETPVEVKVDGMYMKFHDGTLFSGDVFTITTGDTGIPLSLNSEGQPTGEKMADWHWTIDSFAEQFNRVGQGMKATATLDNRLKFEASDQYYTMERIEYSEENGFDEENVSLTIKNWSAINFTASDLRFERSATGFWGVLNDPTGGLMQILPEGGDDNGFGVDFTSDGIEDMRIDFKKEIGGAGYVQFDFEKREAKDIGFAFSDSAASDAGLAAAAGINTFFNGVDAMTIEVDKDLSDTRLINAAKVNSQTGKITTGDNTNALALVGVQHLDTNLQIWTYQRDGEGKSSTTTSTLDEFYTQMIGSLGVYSRNIKSSKEFADIMVNNITGQRDSVSAVSLDEEMIKLMKYQHAFSAASKLLTTADEMMNTLISVR